MDPFPPGRCWSADAIGGGFVLGTLAALGFLLVHGAGPAQLQPATGGAAIELVALSLALPAILERLVLGPRRDPVEARPGRRAMAAVAAAGASALAAVAAAVILTGRIEGGDAHALAIIALLANAAAAASGVLPLPGLPGWQLLLAAVERARRSPSGRLRLARDAGHLSAVVLPAVAAGAGVLAGAPVLAAAGPAVAVWWWIRVDAAVHRRRLGRFLDGRRAGDVCRPIVQVEPGSLPPGDGPWLVLATGGRVIGVLGRRQQEEIRWRDTTGERRVPAPGRALPPTPPGGASTTGAVPFAELTVTPGSGPAMELLPDLARYGFALVRARDGLAVAVTAELARQAAAWDGAAGPE